MDLALTDKLFLVTGGTSGFGRAISQKLLEEGAKVIVNARGEEKLQKMTQEYGDQIETVGGDITTDATISKVIRLIGNRKLDGLVVNAGGPPAKSFIETEISDWDEAYKSVLRWKVKLVNHLLEKFMQQNYGRILFIESISVKQPIENLVLSNSLRLAVIGFVKTLSQEIAANGITLNVLAPGYHATPAMDRLFEKKSQLLGISAAEARVAFEAEIKTGKMGKPEDLAEIGAWLLSENSRYVTGQTISIDGGLAKGTFS